MYDDFEGEWRFYTRISKKEKKSKIWETQIPSLVRYAESVDLLLSDEIWYEDDGFTGMNTDRPGYRQMTGDMRAESFGILTVALDRLNRNLHNAIHLLDGCKKHNTPILSLREPLNIFTLDGEFMYKLHSLIAERESMMISERTKRALKQKKK